MIGPVKNAQQIILKGRSKPMTLPQLHEALDAKVEKWVRRTCAWRRGWQIGDHRSTVFVVAADGRVNAWVELRSEPMEPVLCGVPSGTGSAPTDVRLANERWARIRDLGFELRRRDGPLQREFPAKSRSDMRRAARAIVDVLHAGFDYTGTHTLHVLAEGRSRSDQGADAELSRTRGRAS
jgi:hypothetical protein